MKKFLAAVLLSIGVVGAAEATTVRLVNLEIKNTGTGEIFFAMTGTVCTVLNSSYVPNAGFVVEPNPSSVNSPFEVALSVRCPALRVGEPLPELQDEEFTVRATRVVR